MASFLQLLWTVTVTRTQLTVGSIISPLSARGSRQINGFPLDNSALF